ncbi:GspH/FimT family protein [Stenotrophomonas sp.]|uniref:GspH/FimT family protein n=1 Tax=Stenotrophomonas sp. TaxID=69392 RepID=UPI00289CE938|nr:GspH/FimT family protein [Stenotrophomonas sp.]
MQPRRRPSRHLRGMTLLELSLALAIVALLCLLALPSLGATVSRMRADSLRMQLVSVFNSARSTAITRHEPVAVCPSADGRTCGSDWSRGWLIHRDHGDSGVPPAQDDIFQFRPGYLDAALRATSSQGRRRLRFQRDGRSSGSPMTVDICAAGALRGQVIVNNVGRTRAPRIRDSPDCPP